MAACHTLINNKVHGKQVYMCSDSQAGLKALGAHAHSSSLSLECSALLKSNNVSHFCVSFEKLSRAFKSFELPLYSNGKVELVVGIQKKFKALKSFSKLTQECDTLFDENRAVLETTQRSSNRK